MQVEISQQHHLVQETCELHRDSKKKEETDPTAQSQLVNRKKKKRKKEKRGHGGEREVCLRVSLHTHS